jgi:PKD repeat protein
LTPKALFRAYPTAGRSPLTVRFQNFSNGDIERNFWDFGDYITSFEKNPTHTYANEGIYTVSLNVITSTGALATATKNNYITVSNDESTAFFYWKPANGTLHAPAEIDFVDQSLGNVEQRIWSFGDAEGTSIAVDDPNNHTANFTYLYPGTYTPSLLVVYGNSIYKKIFSEEITIL